MKLVLENIGMLKSAEVTLNQLTVIAGENDNGKSTVGKVVFCIIKAINRYKEDLQESKDFKLDEKLRELFFTLRRGSSNFDDEVELAFKRLQQRTHAIIEDTQSSEVYADEAKKLKSLAGVREEFANRFDELCDDIYSIAVSPEDEKKSIESALNKVFASEFDSTVLHAGARSGSIRLFENQIKLLDIKVHNGNKFTLEGDVEPIELKDATFIESPLILNNHDLLIRSQSGLNIKRGNIARLGMPYTTLHTKDLFDKLLEPGLGALFVSKRDQEFKDRLEEIISGEVQYDNSSRDFIYRRDGADLSIKNTASGIKVFGLLQLLITNDFMSKNTLFVFDEPENHLHPKWQLKLADVLVQFAKQGVYILVSSHSPYMIEALKRYADCHGLEEATRFYLAEDQRIEDRDRMEDIFKILAEPFELFRRMDAENLRDE